MPNFVAFCTTQNVNFVKGYSCLYIATNGIVALPPIFPNSYNAYASEAVCAYEYELSCTCT